jgi:hypothetical protein
VIAGGPVIDSRVFFRSVLNVDERVASNVQGVERRGAPPLTAEAQLPGKIPVRFEVVGDLTIDRPDGLENPVVIDLALGSINNSD